MKLDLYQSSTEASNKVADHIAKSINDFKPTQSNPFVLGLPTGSSPLKVYQRLIEHYKQGTLDFTNVVSFNMDEYYKIQPDNEQSYHYFMYDNFFNHVNFKPENINILNGLADDWAKECFDYEAKIKSYGGIHIFLGGLGPEGHIAFNESGSTRNSTTRMVDLVESTIKANCRFFDNDEDKVPKHALTVGISTVLDNSDEVIIVVFGQNKRWALNNTLTQKPNAIVPSTFLKTHSNIVIVADYDAIEDYHPSKL